MSCSIELVSGDNARQWEEFNSQSPEGTLFHSLKWKQVLEETLHLKLRYYLIRSDKEVVGICPWAERSVMNFRGLVSIPHSDENGVLLDDQFDTDRFDEVLSLLAKRYSFLHFNTGNRALSCKTRFVHHRESDATGHMMVDLRETPPDTIWAGLSKSTRQAIRTFENDEFQIHEVPPSGDIGDFYRYYTRNLTHIRGEILPLAFFERIRDLFPPDELRITALVRDNLFAGGSLAIADPARKRFYGQFMALNRALPNRYTPAYYIMWEDINWAWKNGYERISFGRQKLDPENTRFRNKAKFGVRHLPIHSNLFLLSKPIQVSYKVRKVLLKGEET